MDNQNIIVPLWHKTTLTVTEASELTGITEKTLRSLCYKHPEVCLEIGSSEKRHPKILLKRRKLEELIENLSSVC